MQFNSQISIIEQFRMNKQRQPLHHEVTKWSKLSAAVDPVAARIAVPPTANCPDAGILDPYVNSIGTPTIDAAAEVIDILFRRSASEANGPS
ncbi:predicted protein [Chaetoceros tenuissimus]|uniref:Uncharacterized protein n=1 Tax=Chaetoceros tenuissimus TaxID=426638 RepID=A0AAD3GZX8_9STRA|nr:predicted protein [Chaetoceros tenuissimus]